MAPAQRWAKHSVCSELEMGESPATSRKLQAKQRPRSVLLQVLVHLPPSARRLESPELVPFGGWAWIPQFHLESTMLPSKPSQQHPEVL